MKCIAESLNVMSKVIGTAMKERNAKPIQELAVEMVAAGTDWIDLNLGPAKKGGPELMEWLVKTVQEVAPKTPLALDTSNIEAIEAGLKACKLRPLINSIMARPERYSAMIPLAAKYNAQVIALMWGPEGLPRDENERAALCVELNYAMNEAGIQNEDIFVDGIVTPLNIQQPQLMSLLAFQEMLPDIAPGCKSTCGLSNSSNGTPVREIINQTFMIMLERRGMHSCIMDHADAQIMAIAKGQRPDVVEVVHQVMDGADPKPAAKELMDYVKTAKVILGHTLYSDSYLEL
jgi:5-methyltetrahydrofolate corrinoid/iron sulfur protein methyltransferase